MVKMASSTQPYTYGLERIEVEALDETRSESQDPLYYLYDGLGSVTFMVKPDGNKRDHYRYDEFGKPAPGNSKLSQDGKNVLHNTFGYTGEMWDQQSELLYLRARYYEPETGRFLSRDSYEGNLQNPLSRHLYAYVANNPVNFVDPIGNARLFINGREITGGFSVLGGHSIADPQLLASNFNLNAAQQRDIFGLLTNKWDIYRNVQYKKEYISALGQISIRQFANDWGISLSYSKFENIIYLGTQLHVTAEQLKQLGWHNVNEDMVWDLNKTLEKYDITTTDRIRHFISQCMQETNKGLWLAEEDFGDETYFDRQPYGRKYRGAGYIHLTWEYNYEAFANYMQDQRILTEGADYVAQNYAWEVAGYWWKNNNMNALIDSGASVRQVTKKVNGGYGGIENREYYYSLCCDIIG